LPKLLQGDYNYKIINTAGRYHMKKLIFTLILTAIFSTLLFASKPGMDDVEAIKEVITTAYVDGVRYLGNISDIEKGFHPKFIFSHMRDNHLNKLTANNFIEGVNKRKKDNPNHPQHNFTVKFSQVDANGNTGFTKFEIYQASKLVFTD